jgi:adenylate cyclase
LCASSWRVVSDASDTGFDELRDLCVQTGDQVSLALGLAGQVTTVHLRGDIGKAVRLGTELVELLESIGDPALDVGLLLPAINISWTTGRVVDAMRLAQRVIDLAEGDSTMGNLMLPSPLAQALGVRALADASSADRTGSWTSDGPRKWTAPSTPRGRSRACTRARSLRQGR